LLLLVHCAGSTLAVTEHHRCIYDHVNRPADNPDVVDITQQPPQSMGIMAEAAEAHGTTVRETAEVLEQQTTSSSVTSTYMPIRIKVFLLDSVKRPGCKNVGDTYLNVLGKGVSCTKEDIMSQEKWDILNHTIIPEAVKLHADRLNVKPLDKSIVMPNYSDNTICGRLEIPEEHKTKGVKDADMVLYATAAPIVDGTFAWATMCAVHTDGRPLIGMINYSPRHIARTSQAVRVAAHEIAHTLGFSVAVLNARGSVKESSRPFRGRYVYLASKKSVKKQMELHYGCKSSEGMELEDEMVLLPATREKKGRKSVEKEEPIAGLEKFGLSSHWKRRHAKDELMAGLVGAGHYTGLTLAAFEGLGYYSVDYSKAETMSWGKNAKCEFLWVTKCVVNGETPYPSMFCTDSTDKKLRCTSDRQALGTCVIENHTKIPEIYSYFKMTKDNKMPGGRREDMMDYCPIIVASTGFSCIDGTESKMPGSLIREDSRCVHGNGLTVKGKPIG
ncbi:surface protease GP63, partial [Trypanosoma grayi]|uniref:surface protease GP63 n=1 Tax=Trypanosoma grayi TaxID=71804 RepID=UPI0004F402E9